MPAIVENTSAVTAELKAAARRIGFDLVGVAPAVTPDGVTALREWLDRGYAGQMSYMERREDAYEHPNAVMPSVRSVIMLGLNYRSAEPPQLPANTGRVARYAWGERDYHDVIRDKLSELEVVVRELVPNSRTRKAVDTAPLLERDFARLAGLGWFGKNTMLINKRAGSWLFLAALLVDVELEYDAPHETSHCGTCTRCLDACPTDAFPEPYVLDARRCISYHTIELREPIPLEFREGIGEWLFGCDICQDVCPWNRKAPVSTTAEFNPLAELHPTDLIELLQLDDAQFTERFHESPLSRPKRAGLLRNAAIVLGNRGDRHAVPALISALGDAEPLIRGAAAWALGQLGGISASEALSARQNSEDDSQVRDEIDAAIQHLTTNGAESQ